MNRPALAACLLLLPIAALAQAAQGKTAEAAATHRAFDDAWKLSDVKLTASRL